MVENRVISADSHFVEPPDMWVERMDKKFRERAPHTVRGFQGKEGEFFVCENINPVPVAAFFGAGVPSEDMPEHIKKGFEGAPASMSSRVISPRGSSRLGSWLQYSAAQSL